MPRARNTEAAYAPAIAALRVDLADLEHRAAETTALIKALCARAGIAGEPAAAPVAPAVPSSAPKSGMSKRKAADVLGVDPRTIRRDVGQKAPKSEAKRPTATGSAKTKTHRANVAGKGGGKGSSGSTKSEPPEEKDAATLAELGVSKRQAEAVSGGGKGRKPKPLVKLADLGITEAQSKDDQASAQKIVAVISEASAEVQSAMRANDANKLSAAISARATAERVAGKLLVALAGKRPLPPGISKAQSKKYRRVAGLSAGEFAAALRRSQNRALRRIGAPDAVLDAIGAPPSKPAKDRPSHAAPPHPRMKLTPWTTDSTGALTRTLTAEVDGGGAEAT